MNISIVGSGYVGISAAVCFADLGHTVYCIDVDREKVAKINGGIPIIYEEGLEGLLKKNRERIKATTDYSVIRGSDISFICVGTPSNKDGSIDLKYVEAVSAEIGRQLKEMDRYHVTVVKSTVVPTTTETKIIPVLEKYSGKKAGKGFGVCMNPEFLKQGSAIRDFSNQDRIIIGEYDKSSGDVLEQLYQNSDSPILRMDLRTAEMIKYASNSFLAAKISFINEVGNICKKIGIDIHKVAEGMGYDPRIGRQFLDAGIGYGGSCFPKDTKALSYFAKSVGYEPKIIDSVIETNETQHKKMVEIMRKKAGVLKGKKIAVLGASFKKGTDDLRDSKTIPLIRDLLDEGAEVVAFDPVSNRGIKNIFGDRIRIADSVENAVKSSDIISVATSWDEFKKLEEMEDALKGKTVIEGRRTLDSERMKQICDFEGVCW